MNPHLHSVFVYVYDHLFLFLMICHDICWHAIYVFFPFISIFIFFTFPFIFLSIFSFVFIVKFESFISFNCFYPVNVHYYNCFLSIFIFFFDFTYYLCFFTFLFIYLLIFIFHCSFLFILYILFFLSIFIFALQVFFIFFKVILVDCLQNNPQLVVDISFFMSDWSFFQPHIDFQLVSFLIKTQVNFEIFFIYEANMLVFYLAFQHFIMPFSNIDVRIGLFFYYLLVEIIFSFCFLEAWPTYRPNFKIFYFIKLEFIQTSENIRHSLQISSFLIVININSFQSKIIVSILLYINQQLKQKFKIGILIIRYIYILYLKAPQSDIWIQKYLYLQFKQVIINMKIVKNQVVLLIVVMLVNLATSIYFGVSSKPFCFEIEQQPGKTIKFSYQVTGQSPEQMQLEVVPHDPSRRITLKGQQGKTQFSGDYENNVCFTSTDGKYKSVSVDFYTSDKAHLMELAKKSEIYQLHTKLIEVGENLKQIGRNEQFEQQRQIIHSQIIVSHQNTIKYFAVAKLLVIIVVALGQLYLLKSMLDKSGRGYQPV